VARLTSILVILLVMVMQGISQQSPDELLQYLMQSYYDPESEGEPDLHLDELSALLRNPINLNTADRAEFEQIFFIGDDVIEAIIAFRDSFGTFLSFYELAAIEGIPVDLAKNMIHFLTLENNKSRRERLQSEIKLTGHFSSLTDSTSGSPGRFRLSASCDFEKLSLSLMAEQDKEEPFPEKRGIHYPDHLAGNLLWEASAGKAKLLIGTCGLDFGSGNLYSSGMQLGLTRDDIGRTGILRLRNGGLGRETGNFNGLAGVYRTGFLSLLGILSYTPRDGEILSDGEHKLINFDGTGYHNTSISQSRADALKEIMTGVGIAWDGPHFQTAILSTRYVVRDSIQSLPLNLHSISLGYRSRSFTAAVEGNFFNIHSHLASAALSVKHSEGLSASLRIGYRSNGLSWTEEFRQGGRLQHDRQLSFNLRMQPTRNALVICGIEAYQDYDVNGYMSDPSIRSLVSIELNADNPIRLSLAVPASFPMESRLSIKYDRKGDRDDKISLTLSMNRRGSLAMLAWSSPGDSYLRLKCRFHVWQIADDSPMLYAWQNDVASLGRIASFNGSGQQLSIACRIGRHSRFETGLILRQGSGLIYGLPQGKPIGNALKLELSFSTVTGT
jgi:hypothetical protein